MFNGSCRPTLVMEFSGRPKASATLATVIVRTDFLDINQCGNTTVDNIFLVTKYSCKIFVQSRVPSYNRSKSRMLQDLQLRSGVAASPSTMVLKEVLLAVGYCYFCTLFPDEGGIFKRNFCE